MPFYSQTTSAQFTAALALALGDPSLVFWAQDELDRALNEALLTWGALTSYWTTNDSFNTVASTPFYDLSVELPTLRRRDYTLDDLTKEIQYHFLEPTVAGVAGTGMTNQFSINQITSALVRRRNQFVIDAKLPLTTGVVPGPSRPDGSLDMDQSIIGISRAAWIAGATGITSPLGRTDYYAAQAYSPLWNLNPGKPYGYSQAEAMPGVMLVVPPPSSGGSVHLVYSQSIDPVIAGFTTLQIPDEFAWAIKWGAIYDLLATHNPGFDPTRAKYALERYNAAVAAAALHRSMLRILIGNTYAPVVTLAELDSGTPHWQTGTGVPKKVAVAYDLLAFYRVPNGVYTIDCGVVQTAPLPASGSAFVQVGREELPYLYDFCRHILSWKMGGAEFLATIPLYDSFLSGAKNRNSLLSDKIRYLTSEFQRADVTEEDAKVA